MDKVTYCEDALDQRIADLEAELHYWCNKKKSPGLSSHLRKLFDSNLIPICRGSVNGSFLDVNKAFEELTGYSKEELLSLGWKSITPPEWAEQDAAAVRQIRESGRAEPYEKEYIRKDGTRVSIFIAATAFDTSGDNVMAFFINMTEIRDGEMRIKESEAQFRLLVETIPQIVWISDTNSNVEYINRRFADYTGLDESAGLQQAWASVIHPDDLPAVLELSEKTRANGENFEMELRHKFRDGTYHWSLCRSLPMKAPDGRVMKSFGTATDIDEQKRVEEGLRQREMHFRMLADSIPQIVWTAAGDGKIDFFNHRWLEYTGLSIEQSLNNGWQLLLHPADLEQYMRRWNNALQTGETYEFDFRLRRAMGLGKTSNGYRWHLCRAVALRNSSGRIIKWFGTWTEIHEQRKAD